MFRFLAVLLVAVLVTTTPAQAGKFNKKLSVGDAAPSWNELEGVDGKKHSLAHLKDKDVVIMVITCNHCPFAIDHEDRIIALAKKYTAAKDSKVALVAISIDLGEQDTLEKMKKRAKEKGFTYPYVQDPSQKVGREYGATVTPQFFVLNKERKIAYMGSLDDSPDGEKVTVKHLENALEAILKGEKPAKEETMPQGCGIDYVK